MVGRPTPALLVATPTLGQQDRFTCLCCGIKFESASLQRGHFKTEWHLYNLKRKICSLGPIDLEGFIEIQKTLPALGDDASSIFSGSILPLMDTSSDDDWEHINRDEFLDEDYNDNEISELLAKIVKSDTCLFCDRKSSNIKQNIEHMNLMHGFFIPEEKYLIDLEGLMEYLGFKVGAGATCLWCNKQFTTVHGVRLHMSYKDHCKIFYNQEKAIEEFKEFYDYSTQEQIQMKPLDQLVLSRRRSDRRGANFSKSMIIDTQQLDTKSVPSFACQARSIKKFDSYRAKILLRTSGSNNNTMRGRIRHQNPK